MTEIQRECIAKKIIEDQYDILKELVDEVIFLTEDGGNWSPHEMKRDYEEDLKKVIIKCLEEYSWKGCF